MEIALAPVSRLGKSSRVAVRLAQPLFDWVDGRQDPAQALVREIRSYLSLPPAVECPPHLLALSRLVRGHAMDLWEDDGFDALSWHQGLITGVQLVLMSQGIDDRPMRLRLSGVCSGEDAFSINTHGLPQASEENSTTPQVWRFITMDDVAREIDATSHRQVLSWVAGLTQYIKTPHLPMIALTSGAWLGLAIGGRLTGLGGFVIQGPSWDSAVYLVWQDSRSGGGPTGEQLPVSTS